METKTKKIKRLRDAFGKRRDVMPLGEGGTPR